MKEEIAAYGHLNVTSKHKTTLEITKAKSIGRIADCIIAVRADKVCGDLNKELKNALKGGRRIEIKIEAEGVSDVVTAYGSPKLKLTHPEDIVIRKSDFIDERTLAISADKSASDLKENLIEKLRNKNTKVKITLEIK
jgi:hypothetical protein